MLLGLDREQLHRASWLRCRAAAPRARPRRAGRARRRAPCARAECAASARSAACFGLGRPRPARLRPRPPAPRDRARLSRCSSRRGSASTLAISPSMRATRSDCSRAVARRAGCAARSDRRARRSVRRRSFRRADARYRPRRRARRRRRGARRSPRTSLRSVCFFLRELRQRRLGVGDQRALARDVLLELREPPVELGHALAGAGLLARRACRARSRRRCSAAAARASASRSGGTRCGRGLAALAGLGLRDGRVGDRAHAQVLGALAVGDFGVGAEPAQVNRAWPRPCAPRPRRCGSGSPAAPGA